MTENTAQPLTREDITAAMAEALKAVTVRTINKPTEYTIRSAAETLPGPDAERILRNFGIPGRAERAARHRHPAGKRLPLLLTCEDFEAIVSERVEQLLSRLQTFDSGAKIADFGLETCDDGESAVRGGALGFLGLSVVQEVAEQVLQLLGADGVFGECDVQDVESGHDPSPSVDSSCSSSVGASGASVNSSACPVEKVDDPRISARYDRPLNMIAISVDGEDDVYLPRDGAFTFSDEIAQALEVQAKLGGAA